MSSGLAGLERFLSDAGFDRAPWLAVAFGAGIGAWFGLPSPVWWIAWCGLWLGAAGTGFAWRAGRERYPRLTLALRSMALLLAAGCMAVWARSELVGAPPIARPASGTFIATVLAREEQPALERVRLMLALREPGSGRAIRVRVNVPASVGRSPSSGAVIRLQARLMPPAPPMLPGAYDFARTAWFGGIAATGTALGPIETVTPPPVEDGGTAHWRALLSHHIHQRLEAGQWGIAAALATGDEGGISKADAQAMRDAGLAHLLSISGLHVSAVIGATYLLALRLLALVPWLALRVRLPVLAAGAGATAGLGYTLLTGSEVPTVRSCIGALLVLAALALGREPLSLRMLAVAAFCVLLLWPEAVAGPSFQMSFGAVLALVALASAAPVRRFLAPREEGLAARALRHLAMVLLTGVVIELTIMPVGIYHFHRAGIYGALANVVAIPLTTFAIMPLVALALALDLAGAGAPAWWLAGQAIDLLTGLAHWIALRPGSVALLPAVSTGAFLIFVAGTLWLGLWSGRVRLFGLVPALAGAGMMAATPSPDLLVSGDGRHVALIDGQRLHLLRRSRSDFVRDNLSELAGLDGDPMELERWPGARCNRDFCSVTVVRDQRRWHLLLSRGHDAVPERALAAACDRADVVVSDRWLPGSCRPRWLKADRAMLESSGGLAITLANARVESVADGQGKHPWWRAGRAEKSSPQ